MKKQKQPDQQRRRFISDTIKISLLATILAPIEQACNSNKNKNTGHDQPDSSNNKQTKNRVKRKRQKWSQESLVENSKTKVLHFPTSKVYHYYDEIKPAHLQTLGLSTLASRLESGSKINKGQSGNILEIATLSHLANGINDEYLNSATNMLATAFSEACNNIRDENMNEKNFRLHELMLQLIALYTTIPAESKWQAFNSKIKRPASLRKRQTWMSAETLFNDRVRYILERKTEYENRLAERAKKYNFT